MKYGITITELRTSGGYYIPSEYEVETHKSVYEIIEDIKQNGYYLIMPTKENNFIFIIGKLPLGLVGSYKIFVHFTPNSILNISVRIKE